MLNVYGTSDGSFTRLKVKRDKVEELPARYDCLWVDFVEESLEEVVKLLERLFSERVELLRQLPSPLSAMRTMQKHKEVSLPLLRKNGDGRHGRLHILFNAKVLATVRSRESNRLTEEATRTLENLSTSTSINVDLIFCRLLDETPDDNEFLIEELRDKVDKLEQEATLIESENVVDNVRNLEREMGKIHDILQSQRGLIINSIERLLPSIGESLLSKTFLLNAERKVERQLDLVDHYDRELAEAVSLSDLALTIRLSRIMTLLTAIATVLLLPNTVATILGIPSLPIPSTAWGIVGALIIISGILPAIYAYKKGWLKP